MMTIHCSEEELQQVAERNDLQDKLLAGHIATCAHCQQQVALYRLLFESVKEQPAAAFDFDLATAVTEQLAPVKTKSIAGAYRYAAITAIGLLVISSLWVFRKNFANLSAGVSVFFLLMCFTACTAIIGFKALQLIRRYQLQIKKLNFSE